LENYSTGADCASTLACLRALGVKWEHKTGAGNVIEVQGNGPALSAPSEPLDCGNSGSTIRMLSGIVAGQKFTSEMAGDESLARRPMERVNYAPQGYGRRHHVAKMGARHCASLVGILRESITGCRSPVPR